jgi:hypothetical protein
MFYPAGTGPRVTKRCQSNSLILAVRHDGEYKTAKYLPLCFHMDVQSPLLRLAGIPGSGQFTVAIDRQSTIVAGAFSATLSS